MDNTFLILQVSVKMALFIQAIAVFFSMPDILTTNLFEKEVW